MHLFAGQQSCVRRSLLASAPPSPTCDLLTILTGWLQLSPKCFHWDPCWCIACGAAELGLLPSRQLAPLIDSLSELDAPLSAASPVQEAPLAQYQQALRQVRLPLSAKRLPA